MSVSHLNRITTLWPPFRGSSATPTPPVTLPSDILAALKIAVEATATFADLTGGYFNTSLPLRPSYPCAVGTVRPGRVESRTSSYDRMMLSICLRVYANDPNEAKTLCEALHAEIKGALLDFTGALVTKLLPESEPQSSFIASRSGSGIIRFTERKYSCRVRRTTTVAKLS